MIREIIEIDEELCNGCAQCIPGCHEGALQIIDGKARLISDLMCDGLGACVGHCPTGAMQVVQREAQPYDERSVMIENIIPAGLNTIQAHLKHLEEHGESAYLAVAKQVLAEQNIRIPAETSGLGPITAATGHSCPGSAARSLAPANNNLAAAGSAITGDISLPRQERQSALGQWPVQLHLLNPAAPYFNRADVLLAADCTAFSMADFHDIWLKGKVLAIACPKLDQGTGQYVEKLMHMIDESQINSISVMMMEVPCCSGLLAMVQAALSQARRKVPVKKIMVSIRGELLDEQWL